MLRIVWVKLMSTCSEQVDEPLYTGLFTNKNKTKDVS